MKVFNSEKGIWENYVKTTNKKFSFGESVTDKSRFRPNVSSLNNVVGVGMNINPNDYTFPDGVDNGLRMYELNNPALDITEKQKVVDLWKAQGELAKDEVSNLVKEELSKLETKKENHNATVENNTTTETVKNG